MKICIFLSLMLMNTRENDTFLISARKALMRTHSVSGGDAGFFFFFFGVSSSNCNCLSEPEVIHDLLE